MLKYRIALINVFWCEKDINTRYFDNIEEQELYFNALTGGKFSPLVNFNIGNNVDTSIIYKDVNGRSIEELLSCNYAVVEKYNEDNNEVVSRRFYYAYPQQDVGTQLRVILSLDDIQTNYIKYKKQISPCSIKRACLNRWVKNGDNTYSFNNSVDSPLLIPENFNSISKRLIKRTTLTIHPDENENSAMNQWLDNNVLGWVYLYITQGDINIVKPDETDATYNIEAIKYSPKEVTLIGKNDRMNKIKGSLAVLCYPVYKTSVDDQDYSTIQIKNGDKYLNINEKGLQNFLNKNNGYIKVYARKFSLLPPFASRSYNSNEYEVGGVNNLRLIGGSNDPNIYEAGNVGLLGINFGSQNGLFYVTQQFEEALLTNTYEVSKPLTFTAQEIINGNNNPILNPKLLNQEFYELNVELGGQRFVYDYQKLNKRNIKLSVTEALTPDVTRNYLRIHDTQGVYIDKCEFNYTGLVYSNDNSLMVDNDQLSAMLANNKNFWLQSNINPLLEMGGGAFGLLTGNKAGATDLIKGSADFAKSIINMNLTIDNLRNAPNVIKNANGSVVFNNLVTPFKPHIEEYDILEYDKKIINDYLIEHGYAVNTHDYIYNYDNIRSRFNYIEADVEVINAPLSNIEKERLKDKLRAVRFWNSDEINYDLENYERGLNNG